MDNPKQKNVEKVNSIGKNIVTEKQLISFRVKKELLKQYSVESLTSS
jgi:hypothetical protein